MTSVRDKKNKYLYSNFFKNLCVHKSASGSHKNVCPIFPYSIQITIKEEKAKANPPKRLESFVILNSLSRRYIKNAERIGAEIMYKVQPVRNGKISMRILKG